jgi:hypothetical protein
MVRATRPGPVKLVALIGALGLLAACEGDFAAPPELRLLVPGQARLAGWGGDGACSQGEPAAADGHRWCAFYRPAPEDALRTELWVIDVTRVQAGASVAPACDGSDPGCRRMTDRLFTELRIQSMSHPEAHRFEGDTLFFLADPHPDAGELERFEGFVWAWRPGWQRPRALTTERGVQCQGSRSGLLAYCLDRVSDEPLEFDLRAGPLVDREDALLPLVERVAPTRGGGISWTALFSREEDLFVFSSWREGEAGEALRTVPVAELGRASPRTVVEDGYYWTLAADGQAVFFLRGSARDRDRGEGTLWAADFPAGAAAELAPGVAGFEPLAGEGITFVTELRGLEGVLNVVRDRRKPEGRFTLAPDAHAWYPLGDGRFTYVLQVDDAGERGLIGDNDTGKSCRLGSRPDAVAYTATLIPNLGMVHWSEPDPVDENAALTYLARPEDCGGVRLLGRGLQYLRATGRSGLVVGQVTGRDLRLLRFSHVPHLDDRPVEGAGKVILPEAERDNLSVVGRDTEAIVFGTPETAPQGRGLHIFGPLGPAR